MMSSFAVNDVAVMGKVMHQCHNLTTQGGEEHCVSARKLCRPGNSGNSTTKSDQAKAGKFQLHRTYNAADRWNPATPTKISL